MKYHANEMTRSVAFHVGISESHCVGISGWLICLLILSEHGDKDFITYS